jgi:hypothetical protein
MLKTSPSLESFDEEESAFPLFPHPASNPRHKAPVSNIAMPLFIPLPPFVFVIRKVTFLSLI